MSLFFREGAGCALGRGEEKWRGLGSWAQPVFVFFPYRLSPKVGLPEWAMERSWAPSAEAGPSGQTFPLFLFFLILFLFKFKFDFEFKFKSEFDQFLQKGASHI